MDERQLISPKPKDRTLESFSREQIPSNVKSTLTGALQGDLQNQELLFSAMSDTWPRLQTNLAKIATRVANTDWTLNAWAPRGQQPSKRATKQASEIEHALWGMSPNSLERRKGFLGTVKDLTYGFFAGHVVNEIFWTTDNDSPLQWAPESTRNISARFYRYPSGRGEMEDILMLNKEGQYRQDHLEPFDNYPGKFLIGIRQGHRSHPALSAPLRALSQWWLASVYGVKWMMNFSQLFGIPMRWGTYPTGDTNSKAELAEMLENMGSSGWAATPDGTDIEIKEAGRGAGDLPQKVLIEMADRACDIMILGATLTSDVGSSGSRSLGGVHQDTEAEAIEGVVEFVEDIINEQLIPEIMRANYGETKEIPWIKGKQNRPKDELSMSMRDKTLILEGGLEVAKDWFYDRYQIPMPGKDDEIFEPREEKMSPNVASDPDERKAQRDMGTRGNLQKPEDQSDSDNADSPQARAAAKLSAARNKVMDEKLEELSGGVKAQFLSGVRPTFDRLLALAMSDKVEDADLVAAIETTSAQLPELFGDLDTETLRQTMEDAAGEAMMQGALSVLE